MKYSHITPSTFYTYYLPSCTTKKKLQLLIQHLSNVLKLYNEEIQLATYFDINKQSYMSNLFSTVEDTKTYILDCKQALKNMPYNQ